MRHINTTIPDALYNKCKEKGWNFSTLMSIGIQQLDKDSPLMERVTALQQEVDNGFGGLRDVKIRLKELENTVFLIKKAQNPLEVEAK